MEASARGGDTGVASTSTSGREPGPQAAAPAAAVPTALDRDSFTQTLDVLALRVPVRMCSDMMRAFKGFTLDRPRLRCIVADGGSADTKLLLLEEGMTLEGLPAPLTALMERQGLAAVRHAVTLGYGLLSADAVLKRLLPAGVDAPTSFETVGHIAHLNLRDEQLPYRGLIGQVLLDKNPHLRTVVNKVGSIENEFRVFEMEVIAGEARLETEVVQHGSRFRLDFSQVYWNSRLESEHLRLVAGLQPGQVLVDMMAGIGPFAVPAAQKGLQVYANDLNPRSAAYLALNARLNRLGAAPAPAAAAAAGTGAAPAAAGSLRVFNMDGRAFLRALCDTPGGPAAALREAAAAAGPQQGAQQGAQGQEGKRGQGAAAGGNGASPSAAAAGAAPGPGSEAPDAPTQGPPAAGGAAPSAAAASPVTHPAKRQRTAKEKAPAPGAGPTEPPPAVPPGFAPPAGGLLFDHVVMNLPASAIEFLDAFSGAFDPATWRGRPLPLVHCYTFKRAAETEADILAKAAQHLGMEGLLDPAAVAVHVVRDVAPNKLMLCLSFRVPEAVAFKGRE